MTHPTPLPPEPRGPFCQSCGMPLTRPEQFGTDKAGYRVNLYCEHCFRDGAFTDPSITLPQMIEWCTSVMAKEGIMPEPQARKMLAEVLPMLERWRGR